jgi:hypothetical protein
MRHFRTALAGAVCALALAATAQAGVSFGVADDQGKYGDDGGAVFFDTLRQAGLTENRVTVLWDADHPTSIVETGFLARSLPVARRKGVDVVFAVYPAKARQLADRAAVTQFVDFVELLARSYPQVREVIVGNEPNQTRFSPSDCTSAPVAYVNLLAAAYDRLHPLGVTVVSSLSPRGNDNCAAGSNPSWSPVAFVGELGKAYRALGRTAPLFDVFGYHPYPNQATDPLDKGYQWPNAGFANLDRIKQALWDAFGGTAQPTVEDGLRLKLAEIGWQVGVLPSLASLYSGAENVATTTEDVQAQIYADIARRAQCDASIESVLFFGLYDEPHLDRFQAALLRADLSRRPAFDAVRQAVAAGCQAPAVSWRHATTVAGAKAVWSGVGAKQATQRYWAHNLYAEEDVTYTGGLYRLTGPKGKAAAKPVLATSGRASAYFTPLAKYPAKKLAAGWYAYRLELAATQNPARTASFTSPAFKVGAPAAQPAKKSAKKTVEKIMKKTKKTAVAKPARAARR